MTREEGERKLIETGKKIPPHFSMHLTQSQSDPHCRLTTPRGEKKKKNRLQPYQLNRSSTARKTAHQSQLEQCFQTGLKFTTVRAKNE
jgi:hypothetical protein